MFAISTGLDGLGILNENNASATVVSPVLEYTACSKVTGHNLLVPTIMKSRAPADLHTNLVEWFSQFKFFTVKAISGSGDMNGINIIVEGDTTIYKLIPVVTTASAIAYLQQNTGLLQSMTDKIICVLTEEPTVELSRLASQVGVDLLSPYDMQTIDHALTSAVSYLATNKRFYSSVALAVNKINKSANSSAFVSDIKQSVSDLGENIKQSFSEGFKQLTESVTAATAVIANRSEASVPHNIAATATPCVPIATNEIPESVTENSTIAVDTVDLQKTEEPSSVFKADLSKINEEES